MGEKGELEASPADILRVLSFIDGEVRLGNPDVKPVFERYKKEFGAVMNRRYRGPIFVIFLIVPLPIIFIYLSGACCISGAIVGLISAFIVVVVMLEIPTLVEKPNGYWKESVKDFLDVFEPLEEALKAEGWTYEKVRVSRFFEVDVDTTVYILDTGHPPVYVVVWKMGSKALMHIGYRTEEKGDKLLLLTKKIAWAT